MSGREFPEVSMEKIVETVKKAKRFLRIQKRPGRSIRKDRWIL